MEMLAFSFTGSTVQIFIETSHTITEFVGIAGLEKQKTVSTCHTTLPAKNLRGNENFL
jgi:hypothetical protein